MIKAYYAKTDKGPYLNINEDQYLVDLSNQLFGILDGFGGSGIGDVAGQNFLQQVKKTFGKIDQDRDATLNFFYDAKRTLECNFLVNALQKAHLDWFKNNKDKSIFQKSGASILFAVVSRDILTFVNVGKCYLFLLRNKKLKSLIIPDDSSLVAETCMVNNEKDPAVSSLAPDSPGANLLKMSWPTTTVGMYEFTSYQIKELRPQKDDIVLMLTDGLGDFIPENEYLSGVEHTENLRDLSEWLSVKADQYGNKDNRTILVLKF